HAISSKLVAESGRLDSLFFNPLSSELDDWLKNHPAGSKALGEIANVFDVPPFKHIYVGPSEGLPFFTSADLFDLDRRTDKYLSHPECRYSISQRTATGASIPALWPVYLNRIRILSPPSNLNRDVNLQVYKSLEMRITATRLDNLARESVESAIEEGVR